MWPFIPWADIDWGDTAQMMSAWATIGAVIWAVRSFTINQTVERSLREEKWAARVQNEIVESYASTLEYMEATSDEERVSIRSSITRNRRQLDFLLIGKEASRSSISEIYKKMNIIVEHGSLSDDQKLELTNLNNQFRQTGYHIFGFEEPLEKPSEQGSEKK